MEENIYFTLFVFILLKNLDIIISYSYKILNFLFSYILNYININNNNNISKQNNNFNTTNIYNSLNKKTKLDKKLDDILDETMDELMIEYSKNKLRSQQNILLDMMQHNPNELINLIPEENKKSFSTILNNPLTKKIFNNEKLKKKFIESLN